MLMDSILPVSTVFQEVLYIEKQGAQGSRDLISQFWGETMGMV